MSIRFAGLHHVTAIAGDPQENADFYAGTLGLRLVKKTVNFDDQGSYHLYYGDAAGSPGSISTFFSWPRAPRGRRGAGQITATSYGLPESSLGYWTERLVQRGARFEQPFRRFDETVLRLADPDGIPVELVARPGLGATASFSWPGSTVPEEHAVRAVSGVTLLQHDGGVTKELLGSFFGFEEVESEDGRTRYAAAGSGGSYADVVEEPGAPQGETAVGTVHHVAWRAPDEETLAAWREEIEGRGFEVTPVLDRKYFRSVYFREPGGVLFEIATDPPGFAVDEDPDHIGESLQLPPWLEGDREAIERKLPPIRPPAHG